jgi:HlyD family secretion protein
VAAYEKLQAGPSPEEITIAESDLKKAEEALHRAQGAYDRVKNLPDIGARYESVQLQSATIDYERAKAAFALAVAKPDKAAVKQAESQVAAAKARLDAQPSDMRSAQASVARARVELARAELALQQATLRAPFAGTVTTVNAQAGDMLSPGAAVLTVADLSQLQVETEDLDEWGAASVKPDQSVDLLVPSLDNRSVRGRLVSVAMEPTVSASGAVFYKSVITLEQQDPDLRWGMTVRVRFAKLTGGLH